MLSSGGEVSSTSLLKSPWVLLAVVEGTEAVAVPKSDIVVSRTAEYGVVDMVTLCCGEWTKVMCW